jgi:hypothetical protein
LLKVSDGVAKETEKNEKSGDLVPPLLRPSNGTQELAKKMKKSGNLVPPLLRPSNGTQELAKKMKKRGTSSPFARTWWWHQLAPINNKTKRKKRELGLLLCQKLAMEPTCTQKQLNKRKKEKKERKLGLPFY